MKISSLLGIKSLLKLKIRRRYLFWALFMLVGLSLSQIGAYLPSAVAQPLNNLPYPAKEFRGVWVASVANIDWPSQPGLPVTQQKQELIRIL